MAYCTPFSPFALLDYFYSFSFSFVLFTFIHSNREEFFSFFLSLSPPFTFYSIYINEQTIETQTIARAVEKNPGSLVSFFLQIFHFQFVDMGNKQAKGGNATELTPKRS